MRQHGIIYHHSWDRVYGEVKIATTPRLLVFAYKSAKLISSGFIVAGIAALFFTIQPLIVSEASYRLGTLFGVIETNEERAKRAEAEIARARAAQEEAEKVRARQFAQEIGLSNTSFSVYIPKINAKAKILENVSPADQEAYQNALKEGIAHAAGSSFPGTPGGTYLFAHSTDAPWNIAQYNAIFYLLRELEINDEIYIFFLDKLYKYQVLQKEVVPADDVSWLVDAGQGPERLILQTCWPPGTTWKRLIVVATPAS